MMPVYDLGIRRIERVTSTGSVDVKGVMLFGMLGFRGSGVTLFINVILVSSDYGLQLYNKRL